METSDIANAKPEKGWLSNIAGKAFAVTAALALVIPLIGIGQGIGILPGDSWSNSYVNFPTKIEQVIENFRPQEVDPNVTILKPVSFQEHYSGGYSYRDGRHLDSDISFGEGMVAIGTAAATGAAGMFVGGIDRRRVEEQNAQTQEQIDARTEELYAQAEKAYLAELPARYAKGATRLSPDDLGKLAVIGNEKIDKLPDWMRAEVYEAQRDIAMAALHKHDLADKTDFTVAGDFKYAAMGADARAEIFKLQRDQAWKIVDHELELKSAVQQAWDKSNGDATAALAGGLVIGDMMDGEMGPAAAGVGLAVIALVGAAVIGGTAYLTGGAIHENFIREMPDLLRYEEPGVPALISAKSEIEAAREKLASVSGETVAAHVSGIDGPRNGPLPA